MTRRNVQKKGDARAELLIFSENLLFFVFFSLQSLSWLGKLLNTGLKQARRPQQWKRPWKKIALFRLARFVKCGRFFLLLNSWGLFPGSKIERKIRRHAFTFFVKRCRIHVIVRKSVMHVHGCCFAPKTFYYYLDGWGKVICSLTWQQSPWCPVFSIPSQPLAAKGSGGGEGWICLVICRLPFLCVFLFFHPCSAFSLLFSFSLFILFSCHFLLFCHGGFILGFTCIIFF